MAGGKTWFLDTNVIVKEILTEWRSKKSPYRYKALLDAVRRHKVNDLWTSAFVISEVAGRLTEEYMLRRLRSEGYNFLDIKEQREEDLANLFGKTLGYGSKKWKAIRARYETLVSNKIDDFIDATGISLASLSADAYYWAEELLKDEEIRKIPEATPAYLIRSLEAWGLTVITLSMIPIKLADAVIIADAAVLVGPCELLTTDTRLLKVKKDVKYALNAAAEEYPDFVSTDVKLVDASKRIKFQK